MSASSIVSSKPVNSKSKINVVVTHSRPHEDEIVAAALLLGTSNLFDLTGAKIVTVGNDQELVRYEHRKDVLFVGAGSKLKHAGPDRVFDEHGDGKAEGRCAADIVARAMNLDQRVFGELLKEVRDHDLKPHSSPTALAAVMKALYESLPEQKVIEWAMRGARALCTHVAKGEEITRDKELFIEIATATWVEAGVKSGMGSVRFNKTTFGQLMPQVIGAANSKLFTEVSTIFSIMTKENDGDAKRWLETAIKGLAQRQILFCAAVEDFKQGHVEFLVSADQIEGRKAKIAFMESDSGLMDKVFRSKEAGAFDLLVLKNGVGQICFFTNNKSTPKGGLNIDALVAMVRWAEILASGRRPHSWWSMAKEDDHPAVREWFYFKAGNALFNGSKSKPDIQKTRLTEGDIKYILSLAFNQRGVEQFMQENKVLAPRAE
jgi:hypothetical protein